eukprot:5648903-Alexandrium_andersonii.AAC.1
MWERAIDALYSHSAFCPLRRQESWVGASIGSPHPPVKAGYFAPSRHWEVAVPARPPGLTVLSAR